MLAKSGTRQQQRLTSDEHAAKRGIYTSCCALTYCFSLSKVPLRLFIVLFVLLWRFRLLLTWNCSLRTWTHCIRSRRREFHFHYTHTHSAAVLGQRKTLPLYYYICLGAYTKEIVQQQVHIHARGNTLTTDFNLVTNSQASELLFQRQRWQQHTQLIHQTCLHCRVPCFRGKFASAQSLICRGCRLQ